VKDFFLQRPNAWDLRDRLPKEVSEIRGDGFGTADVFEGQFPSEIGGSVGGGGGGPGTTCGSGGW